MAGASPHGDVWRGGTCVVAAHEADAQDPTRVLVRSDGQHAPVRALRPSIAEVVLLPTPTTAERQHVSYLYFCTYVHGWPCAIVSPCAESVSKVGHVPLMGMSCRRL